MVAAAGGADAVTATTRSSPTSADGGATWSAGAPIHADRTRTEHGFVSFVPLGAAGDSVGAVWLDGRDYARVDARVARPGRRERAQHAARRPRPLGAGGAPAGERMLDTMVCTCCRTSAARTRRGVLVAYRDRTPDEVRDIAVARYEGGAWAAPRTVHADHWVFPGCPVNGAVLAARGDTVGVAWFTAPNDTARVNVAFSTDGGRTFGAPTRVDDGAPSGRAGIVLDADGSAVVTWLERVTLGPDAERWRAQRRRRAPRRRDRAARASRVAGRRARPRADALRLDLGALQRLPADRRGGRHGPPRVDRARRRRRAVAHPRGAHDARARRRPALTSASPTR